MKRIGIVLLATLLLTGCRKTKLDDEYAIFVGKWKWVGCTQTKTVISNGNESYSYIDASTYPDEYFIEFEAKGYVRFFKNDDQELKYRTVIKSFVDNCNTFPQCYQFGIWLNNKSSLTLAGFVGVDSLMTTSSNTNLPLTYHKDNDYEYSYWHKFVKIY